VRAFSVLRRKNSPVASGRPKRWEMAVGEEGQTGRRPLRRERAKLEMPEALEVQRDVDRKVGVA